MATHKAVNNYVVAVNGAITKLKNELTDVVKMEWHECVNNQRLLWFVSWFRANVWESSVLLTVCIPPLKQPAHLTAATTSALLHQNRSPKNRLTWSFTLVLPFFFCCPVSFCTFWMKAAVWRIWRYVAPRLQTAANWSLPSGLANPPDFPRDSCFFWNWTVWLSSTVSTGQQYSCTKCYPEEGSCSWP